MSLAVRDLTTTIPAPTLPAATIARIGDTYTASLSVRLDRAYRVTLQWEAGNADAGCMDGPTFWPPCPVRDQAAVLAQVAVAAQALAERSGRQGRVWASAVLRARALAAAMACGVEAWLEEGGGVGAVTNVEAILHKAAEQGHEMGRWVRQDENYDVACCTHVLCRYIIVRSRHTDRAAPGRGVAGRCIGGPWVTTS